ncbi:MAG: DUF1329 domain-containing protein [Sulfuritalea sp.]|nr:DUF1329 domain-containing protein [Sulfuritalea sp.]
MNVYPTHRSCGYPELINERTKKNWRPSSPPTARTASPPHSKQRLPFPIPKNGAEAVWNHRLRWQGTEAASSTTRPTSSIRTVPMAWPGTG